MPVVRPKHPLSPLSRTPVATAVLLALGSPSLMAQESVTLGEVIVTSQKRSENLQDVPVSIETLDTKSLGERNVVSAKDYAQFLPSITPAPSLGGGGLYYMRGVATGGDGQATTSQPSVGVYLDEQPITTIQGNLDIHMYDIARVEALAGPQGTLYGASSQAGTIRIITNKPDPSGFAAGYALEGNMVDGDGTGYVIEGFLNVPLGENAAIRLVGWSRTDAGWIDNVEGTRTYPGVAGDPTDDITVSNADLAKNNYNTVETQGARAALRVNLGENWALTTTLMGQKADSKGSFGDDFSNFSPGNDNVTHFREEWSKDEWYQVGLTIEGKIANFVDLVYSGNYLERNFDGSFDYGDYSYWYDALDTSGYFGNMFVDNSGNRLAQQAQSFTNNDHYTKTSHELRISTPQENRVRGLLGFFYQKQFHDFEQSFGNLPGLADSLVPNGQDPNATHSFPGTVYLNSMDRTDTDKAIFGQVAFNITDTLEMSVGARYFEPEVTVKGFFGYGTGFNQIWSGTGEALCASQADYQDTPCQNVDKGISESDYVGRVNLTWKPTDDALLYATWSEGYRPGGIQRNPFAGDYLRDILTNWEAGWKTQFAGNRMQFNGAVFLEDWEDIQVSFQGANGITQVANGPSAEIIGTEMQLMWLATDKFRLELGVAYYNSELKDDYANFDEDGNVTDILAPKGSPLPLTPEFKGNLLARYEFDLGSYNSYLQGAFVYSGSHPILMNVADNAYTGDAPSSSYLDLSTGIEKNGYAFGLYIKNALDEDAPLTFSSQCTPSKCNQFQPYGIRYQPRTVGLKFSKEF